jgi:hypothetical protein
MSWSSLAEIFNTNLDEIKLRWKKQIYPKMIRQFYRIGGSLKWSILEDKILSLGYHKKIDW